MLSGKHYVINSLHVVTGALVLVTSLVLTLRAHRARFDDARCIASNGTLDRAAIVARPATAGRCARVKTGAPAAGDARASRAEAGRPPSGDVPPTSSR